MKRRSQLCATFRALPYAMFSVCLLMLTGCSSKPRAPALDDAAVYQNSQAGFRFLVPSGWKQRAKSEIPRGKFTTQQTLVQYVGQSRGGPALLEVTLADLPDSSDLVTFLGTPSHGVQNWKPGGKEQPLELNGAAAIRLVFNGRRGNAEMIREVVAIRRGERIYFLTGLYFAGDTQAQEEVRGAVASILFKG